MRKIPVTRHFDTSDLIGYLLLRDDIEIPPNSVFSFAYTIREQAIDGTPIKIEVRSVSLIPDEDFVRYLQRKRDEASS